MKGINKNLMKIHSVKFNLLMNVILKMSAYIFPFITLPYVTRTLGTLNNGKISFAASVITYFSMFAQLGIPTYGIRECAKCRDDKNKLTQTVQELLVINGGSVTISYVALIICLFFIDKFQNSSLLILINSLTIILNMFGMEWLYQAIEQYKYITIRNITFKIISIVLLFLMVHCQEDYIIYSSISVFSSSGSSILNLWNSRKVLEKKTYFGQYNFKRHLKPIITFFALSIAVSIYTSMDTVMLGFISGEEEVAYYALATKIKMVLASSVAALGPVLLPRISYCISRNRIDEFRSYINKSLHFVNLIAIPIVIYFFIMAPAVIDILGGVEYMPAVKCMRIITFAVLPLGVGNIACQQILAPMGKEKLTMYSTMCGALINFVANFCLISRFGAVGAAVATVCAEAIIAYIQIKMVWIYISDAFSNLPVIEFCIANFAAVCVILLVLKYINQKNSLILMIVSFSCFFMTYSIVILLFKDSLVFNYVFKIFQKKIKN